MLMHLLLICLNLIIDLLLLQSSSQAHFLVELAELKENVLMLLPLLGLLELADLMPIFHLLVVEIPQTQLVMHPLYFPLLLLSLELLLIMKSHCIPHTDLRPDSDGLGR